MIIVIHYKANITYWDGGKEVTRFCRIEHSINKDTLKTVALTYTPIGEEK